MNGARQSRLVAAREVRERSRTRGFQIGSLAMLVLVVGLVVLPAAIDTGGGTADVGLAGTVPDGLATAIVGQGAAAGTSVRVRTFDDVASGEEAVRDGEVDVLVVDAVRLEWLRRADEDLQVVVAGAIQLLAIEERAAAAGIDTDEVLELVAPVPVENVELGLVAGRGPDDEAAATLMTALLLAAIATYGNLVLTGVVEEKASRVVEVLLARMPARSLLAGKVVGIGLLGFAQFAVTAIAALVAIALVDRVDVPSVSAGVLAWVVVWFVLGYAIYAMAYGALGALASRPEDAQSAAGPVTVVLIAGYWVSFMAVADDPESRWSTLCSIFPLTAPFAMPGRVALGAAAWWESLLAVVLTLAAIAGLVALAGRVYTRAILHTGARVPLRDALHGPARSAAPAGDRHGHRWTLLRH